MKHLLCELPMLRGPQDGIGGVWSVQQNAQVRMVCCIDKLSIYMGLRRKNATNSACALFRGMWFQNRIGVAVTSDVVGRAGPGEEAESTPPSARDGGLLAALVEHAEIGILLRSHILD
ncbi:MAG: hypothetical protein H7144_09220 [Burkholderiales bacterium]|nr:hypothetical protein [Phycisphaerae bacterium]